MRKKKNDRDPLVKTTIWLRKSDLRRIKERAAQGFGGNVSLYLRSVG